MNSLILPIDMYRQGDRPRINFRLELGLIVLIYKIQECIYNRKFDIAARVNSLISSLANVALVQNI